MNSFLYILVNKLDLEEFFSKNNSDYKIDNNILFIENDLRRIKIELINDNELIIIKSFPYMSSVILKINNFNSTYNHIMSHFCNTNLSDYIYPIEKVLMSICIELEDDNIIKKIESDILTINNNIKVVIEENKTECKNIKIIKNNNIEYEINLKYLGFEFIKSMSIKIKELIIL